MSTRQILHVDLDAFYASVEALDDPNLRGKPVLVGGRSKRGVVAAASYEARRFGARSAMAMVEALRLCPDAIVVPARFSRYAELSEQVFAIYARYTPLVEPLSIDEAFLDVTASRSLFGDGETIARRIKDEVQREVKLTASAGVAPSKFVAKIASDLRKPDGLVVVEEDEVAEFLEPLPIERMWGVGPKSAPRLHALGLRTFGDLVRAGPARLEASLGAWGREIHAFAQGIDHRPVVPEHNAKSIGAEDTYEEDLVVGKALQVPLLSQAARVARRLHEAGLVAQVVVVKLKYTDFVVQSRRRRLREPADDTDTIYEAARALLAEFETERRRVRLTGISVADLSQGPPPRTLFPDPVREKRRALETAVLAVQNRFGEESLTRAALQQRRDNPALRNDPSLRDALRRKR